MSRGSFSYSFNIRFGHGLPYLKKETGLTKTQIIHEMELAAAEKMDQILDKKGPFRTRRRKRRKV